MAAPLNRWQARHSNQGRVENPIGPLLQPLPARQRRTKIFISKCKSVDPTPQKADTLRNNKKQ